MKSYLRMFLGGCVLALGLAVGGMIIGSVDAASVSQFTGPAGTNPTVESPPGIGTLNQLINNVNTALAPNGSGNMSQFFTLSGTTQLQLSNVALWTTTTSSCKAAGAGGTPTGTALCLILYDSTGTVHYLPVF